VIAIGRFEPEARSQSYMSEIDLVLSVVQRIGCKRFTLCPWSMAGLATIAYAAAQPPELEKLVLVDVAGLGGPLMKRPPAEPPRSAAEWAKRRAASWVHQPGPVRDLVEALDLEELTRTPQTFQRIMEDNRQIRQTPPPLELEKIAVPTLVLAGRHSLVMGPDAAQGVGQRLKHGTVVIFEQSAHALALEESENFQNVVAEFVLGETAR
jgi:pimeloyl-ACP methyl ester carboxylesterase